jgi:hypothetical protein
MKRCLAKLVVVFALVLALTVPFATPVYAATYQDVTVTAEPAYISIVVDNSTWTMNDIVNDGTIEPGTTYYSNPLGDTTSPSSTVDGTECYFSITNSSTVDIDITVDMEDFSGGDANMTNSENGSNSATAYGAYSYYEGMTYTSKVVVKKNATGSDVLWTSSTPGADIKLGVEITTQTNAWSGGSASTSTMKITATKD